MVLAHLRELVEETDLPVNADFEGGFADDPAAWRKTSRCCIATGVAGLSIEDSTSDPKIPLYDFDLALARVKAARAAIDKTGGESCSARAPRVSSAAGPTSRKPFAA